MAVFFRISLSRKGLSLIETLVALVILLVMSASFYQLLTSFYQNYEMQQAIAEIQQQGRVSTDLFWQEIRNAGFDPTGRLFHPAHANKTSTRKLYRNFKCVQGAHPVEKVFEATPLMFHFLADLNQNGTVNGSDPEEQIRYEWVGDSAPDGKIGVDPDVCGSQRTSYTLYRDSGGGMYPVASDIVAFQLRYYDEDGAELSGPELNQAQRERIRKVTVDLTTRAADLLKRGDVRREIHSEIGLRNLE